MYTNSCSKCGVLFQTKNPKRMICPVCLHKHAGTVDEPPASGGGGGSYQQNNYAPEPRNNYNQAPEGGYGGGSSQPQNDSQDYSLYSQPFRPQQGEGGGGYQPRPYQGQQQGGRYQPRPYQGHQQGGGYQPRTPYQGQQQQSGGYQPRPYQGQQQQGGGYQPRPYQGQQQQGGGYQPRTPYQGQQQQGGYQSRTPYQGQQQGGGYQPRPYQGRDGGSSQQGGYQPRPYQGQQQGGYGGGRPAYQGGGGGYQPRPYQGGGGGYQQQRPKGTFIPPQELAEIEKRYKVALPLPNPDIQDTIGKELNMHPKKVFAGINLVRLKMKLPKLDFPKRPLAVTPDQLTAVQTLYEPYISDPPIGIHKIIAKQLRMDEWRVHVAIKLVRKSHNMPRWNEERPDLPEYMKEQLAAAQKRMDEDPEFHEMKDAHATKKENDRLELEAQTLVNATAVESSAEATAEAPEASEEDKPKKRGRPKKEVTTEEDEPIAVVGIAQEAEASLSLSE